MIIITSTMFLKICELEQRYTPRATPFRRSTDQRVQEFNTSVQDTTAILLAAWRVRTKAIPCEGMLCLLRSCCAYSKVEECSAVCKNVTCKRQDCNVRADTLGLMYFDVSPCMRAVSAGTPCRNPVSCCWPFDSAAYARLLLIPGSCNSPNRIFCAQSCNAWL